MTQANRVMPDGAIVADPARGLFMGNRGCLHDANGTLGRARWRHAAWITCCLDFKGRKRRLMQPNRYTELFFLDEAVALAAGHRPCAECRRPAWLAWTTAWAAAGLPGTRAADIDAVLHAARVAGPATLARHRAAMGPLPAGAMILWQGQPALVMAQALHPFTPQGYLGPLPRPSGEVTVLTPAPTLAVLHAGFAPVLHPSAQS